MRACHSAARLAFASRCCARMTRMSSRDGHDRAPSSEPEELAGALERLTMLVCSVIIEIRADSRFPTHSAAVYALTKWLNCSPIYVVNRDDVEVEQFIGAFKQTASEAFNPELIHVKTGEEAENLAAPGEYLLASRAIAPREPRTAAVVRSRK